MKYNGKENKLPSHLKRDLDANLRRKKPRKKKN